MSKGSMQEFLAGRKKAKNYFCNLLSKHMPSDSEPYSKENVLSSLIELKASVKTSEGVYVLDAHGTQVTPTYSNREKIDNSGKDRSDKAYFYKAVRSGKCEITDPYPSSYSEGGLCVTISQAVYSSDMKLQGIACMDMPLEEVIKISNMNSMELFFSKFFKVTYALFAFALMAVALLLFAKGVQSFFLHDITPDHFEIKYVFEATILLTLALAIFDLSKTLIEEELLGWSKGNHISGPHKTMVKFLGSIIIALSIEALMLVFKFAITDPNKLIFAMYIIAGVGILILSLAVYIKFTKGELDK
ncbi:MAG: PDC sensor domain-containing protein [Sulfurimonas sp.]